MIIAVLAKEYCFKVSFYTFLVFRQMLFDFLYLCFSGICNFKAHTTCTHKSSENIVSDSQFFIWKSNFIEKINIQTEFQLNTWKLLLSAGNELHFFIFSKKKYFVGSISIYQWQWTSNMQLSMCILHMHNKLLLITQNPE